MIISKKEKLKMIKDKNKQNALNEMPLSINDFFILIEYIEKKLITNECNNNFKFSNEFIINNNLSVEIIIAWFNELGAFCDCEVLFNIKDIFFKNKE